MPLIQQPPGAAPPRAEAANRRRGDREVIVRLVGAVLAAEDQGFATLTNVQLIFS
jgi:hypothetical protein